MPPYYEDAWEVALGAVGIRPSTEKAITGCLNSHEEDAEFAGVCRIGRRTLRVVKTDGGLALEPETGP